MKRRVRPGTGGKDLNLANRTVNADSSPDGYQGRNDDASFETIPLCLEVT